MKYTKIILSIRQPLQMIFIKGKISNYFFIISLACISNIIEIHAREINPELIEKTKSSMVRINMQILASTEFPMLGNVVEVSGVIINIKKGIILTCLPNTPIVIDSYYVTFCNGLDCKATLIYKDPWLPYAFLKVDPKDIPKNIASLKFSKKSLKINQKIYFYDISKKHAFITHKGIITNTAGITGSLPYQSLNISVNTPTKYNISPIFNEKGEILGLKNIGSETYALAIHPKYLKYAYSYIETNTKPIRKHIGFISKKYPLAIANKMRKFPMIELKKYMKKFRKSRTETIYVSMILPGSPAEGKLKTGDIILKINDKEIGPNLVDLDLLMNKITKNKVKLTIMRHVNKPAQKQLENKKLTYQKNISKWEKQNVNINLYDLDQNRTKIIIKVGESIFFEANDLFSYKLGVKPKSLLCWYFDQGYYTYTNKWMEVGKVLYIQAINGELIEKLDDFTKLIPKLKKNKYFSLDARAYDLINMQRAKVNKIDFYFLQNIPLELYSLNASFNTWDYSNID